MIDSTVPTSSPTCICKMLQVGDAIFSEFSAAELTRVHSLI